MKNKVPVLITCDIDPSNEVSPGDKIKSFERTLNLFDRLKISATFFFVAKIAEDYSREIDYLLQAGHEIGCHGLSHSLEEEYSRLPQAIQRTYLTTATRLLEDLTGVKIRSFRGPRLKISAITHQILEDLHYWADSSVCPQRLDLISSNLLNPGWLIAPRSTYHPHKNSAYRRGDRNLWVVPVSAMVLPFISSTLYALGLKTMKKLFKLLYFEAQRNGKPIVYLLHPVEFAYHPSINSKNIRLHGFAFRRRLKLRINEEKRYKHTRLLLEYISSFENVQFLTISKYISEMTCNY